MSRGVRAAAIAGLRAMNEALLCAGGVPEAEIAARPAEAAGTTLSGARVGAVATLHTAAVTAAFLRKR